jgi:hypothetical protein
MQDVRYGGQRVLRQVGFKNQYEFAAEKYRITKHVKIVVGLDVQSGCV